MSEQQDGQVSEVTRLPDADENPEISDSDQVVDGEETGPDARTGSEGQDDWYGGGRTPGDPQR